MSADGTRGPSASRDLTALLGSRICHDLISPLGAIGNGVELLSMSGISAAPEIALISESVENANARIRFFRIAFGDARPGQAVSSTEIRSILGDMSHGGRLRLTWIPDTDQARLDVKLAFLLVQCLESAMPYGGEVVIGESGGRWTVTGTADRMKIRDELWQLLVDPRDDVDLGASDVHFALIGDAAARAGRRLETDLRNDRIKIAY